ncbi:hypothetical protein COHA_007130 [Chlorella ohadii]|uniref:Uncharacterized protein n=1 Tax=Chlorella ohadii TaxID=2649997 RepID=A0AAD5DK47_9CHLO|nr:hypothetical protein COHA_007130 [Chlorella ohadii]
MMPLAHARRSCVTTKIMQQRTFAFQGSGPTAAQAEVRLWCREPPEAQAGKTLTWQLDSGDASGGQQPPDGAPPPAAAAAAAQPAAAGSNVAPQEDPDLIGLDVWPASIALCRYLANHPEVVAGQQVVELGAGMGLVGLLCAALGAQHVLLTDYEPQVLAHLDKNAALNGLQKRCASLRLDWRQPAASLAQQQQGNWHRIVAADVLYASAVVQPLIATLRLLLHPEGVTLIGHQVRRAIVLDPATRLPRLEDSDEPLEKFKAACAEAALQLRVLSSRETCSNRDSDPMVLLAVGGPQSRLADLPLLPSES